MGGLRVEAETAAASIPVCFCLPVKQAAGCTGANRLGGNSLSDLLVWPSGGLAAAEQAGVAGSGEIDTGKSRKRPRKCLSPLRAKKVSAPIEFTRLCKSNAKGCGNLSEEETCARAFGVTSLKGASHKIVGRSSRLFNPGGILLATQINVAVSDGVALSALERKESRGAHSRLDYPNYDETLGKQNNIVTRDGST